MSDRYEVLEVIGAGGMSVVYKGRHIHMNKIVAIKVLREHFRDNETTSKRFQQEAQTVSHLSHQNIVTVHDFGFMDDGRSYIVMDFVSGKTMADILDEEGGVEVDRALNFSLQICEGLEHAHEAGLIHRDLKPNNLMVVAGSSGRELVKILDFGLAKLLPESGMQGQRLTQTGEFFGTSLYMSPEQCMGKPLDKRSDVYSLGCVMYEFITGLPPIVGENVLDTMQKHINDTPLPIADLRPELTVPDALDKLIFKAMEKRADNRQQSIEELKVELLAAQKESSVAAATRATGIEPDPSVEPAQESKADTAEPKPEISVAVPTPTPASQGNPAAIIIAAIVLFAGVVVAMTFMRPAPKTVTNPPANPAVMTDWKKKEADGQAAYEAGEFDKAEAIYVQTVASLEKQPNDRKLLMLTLRKLADVYYTKAAYDKADAIEERVKELRKQVDESVQITAQTDKPPANAAPQVRDPEQKEVIDRLASLAQMCHKGGQCDRAETLLKRSVEVSTRVFGKDSKETAQRLDDLATFYMSIGEYDKAQSILKTIAKPSSK